MAKSICYFHFPIKKKLKCLYFPLGYFFMLSLILYYVNYN